MSSFHIKEPLKKSRLIDNKEPISEPIILGDKYRVGSKIGKGSFGEIYLAKNIYTDEDVAVKLENVSRSTSVSAGNEKESFSSQLKREAKIYSKLDGEVGLPRLRWLGLSPDKNWMVMDLLGRSLEDLFNYCNRKFSLKTVSVIAYELLSRIETIHSKGKLVHRDIKPENFLMGRGRNRHTVFIIDFGLAKLYENPKTGRHIPQRDGYSLTGTARYASINAHNGVELSRRDDLISIGYALVYFIKGSLPWQGMVGKTSEEKYQMIFSKKCNTSVSDLCAELPEEFHQYFENILALEFDQTPDYSFLKNLFKQLFISNSFTYDNVLYDWEVIYAQREQQKKVGER